MINKKEQLKYVVSRVDKIYIDTCSLMQDKVEFFLRDLFVFVQAQSKRPEVIILQKVLDELENNRRNPQKSPADRNNAAKGADLVWEYERKKYFVRYGSAQDAYADASFLSIFTQKRLNSRILYISEDIKNIRAIGHALNHPDLQIAQRGYPILFYSIRSGIVNVNKGKPVQKRPSQAVRPTPPRKDNDCSPNGNRNGALNTKSGVKTNKQNSPASKFTKRDGTRELTVELLDGDGVFFNKGLLGCSPKKINLILDIYYKGDGKPGAIKAMFKAKDGTYLIKRAKQGRNRYTLEIGKIQFPSVQVTVQTDVKIGLIKAIPFKTTVSKNF